MKVKIVSGLIGTGVLSFLFIAPSASYSYEIDEELLATALMSDDVYYNEPHFQIPGYVRVGDSGASGIDGYYGALYVDNAQNPKAAWIAHRGTQNIESFFEDIPVFMEKAFSQLSSAKIFDNYVRYKYTKDNPSLAGHIRETGHSLGAVIASVMTYSHYRYSGGYLEPDTENCITYENPGSREIVHTYISQMDMKKTDRDLLFNAIDGFYRILETDIFSETNGINTLNDQMGYEYFQGGGTYFNEMSDNYFSIPFVFIPNPLLSPLYIRHTLLTHRIGKIVEHFKSYPHVSSINPPRPHGLKNGFMHFIDYSNDTYAEVGYIWHDYILHIQDIYPGKYDYKTIVKNVHHGLDVAMAEMNMKKINIEEKENEIHLSPEEKKKFKETMKFVIENSTPEDRAEMDGSKYKSTPEQIKEHEKDLHVIDKEGHKIWIRRDVYEQMHKDGVI